MNHSYKKYVKYLKYIHPTNYELEFSIVGFIICWALILPNIVWQIFPPINNLLLINASSYTNYPILNILEWIFRVSIIFLLIFLVNKNKSKNKTSYIIVAIVFLTIYYIFWILYYLGIANLELIILGMVIAPIFYFSFTGLWLKNYILLVPSLLFGIIHLIISSLSYL